jgi:hypothetical protein
MIHARVSLFVAAFLGCLYALLSVMNGSDGDTIAGMAVAGVGILGWGVIDWLERHE